MVSLGVGSVAVAVDGNTSGIDRDKAINEFIREYTKR